MKRRTLFDGLLCLSLAGFAQRQKTAFQTSNPACPKLIFRQTWDASSNTLYLGFEKSPDGIKVDVKW